jgi:hypothetical protein
VHLKAQDLFDNAFESFFLNLDWRLLEAMSTFHFEPKFLKSLVWEAQSNGISSTSLEDLVSALTESESTELV